MLRVPQISRAEIDAWRVNSSGLPVRVVNSLSSVGVDSIGELRKWDDPALLKLRSLGKISLAHIHSFLRVCNSISTGHFDIQSLEELLDIFLDDDEKHVLTERYGLQRTDYLAQRNYMTLQQIANQTSRTRERVRQVEDTVKEKLVSELARTCFLPVLALYREFVDARSAIVSPGDLAELQDHEFFAGYNPCSLLLLVCDLGLGTVIFHHGVFSSLPGSTLDSAASAMTDYLKGRAGLTPLAEVADAARAWLPDEPEEGQNRAASILLDSLPLVSATADGRYFIMDQDFQTILMEVMAQLPAPTHYSTITQQLNDILKPHCRKGSGFVLKALNGNPAYARTERGIYALRSRLPSSK